MDITNPEIRKTTGKALLHCGHKLQKRSALRWETRIYYNQVHALLPRKTYQRGLKVKEIFCITFPGQFTVPNYGISPISTFVMALWWHSSRTNCCSLNLERKWSKACRITSNVRRGWPSSRQGAETCSTSDMVAAGTRACHLRAPPPGWIA